MPKSFIKATPFNERKYPDEPHLFNFHNIHFIRHNPELNCTEIRFRFLDEDGYEEEIKVKESIDYFNKFFGFEEELSEEEFNEKLQQFKEDCNW